MREPVPDATRRPRRLASTSLEQRGDHVIVRDADHNVMLALNESAAALWELCDGSTTIEEMVSAICEVSSIAASRARDDVERTLAEFERAGLLVAIDI
jgi:hypothetical protein